MKKLVSVLLVAAMVFSLVACGSAEKEEPAASETTEEAAPEETASGDLTEVVVVVPRSDACLDDIAMHCADVLGYFEEEGIKFTIQSASNPDDMTLVSTGQADFACPSANLILTSIEAGMPVITASGYDAINIFGFSALNGSGIETWEDLKGKTVALGDAAWATIAAPTLFAAGIDPEKDIEYVVCGDSRYQMVAEGQVDVLFTWISEYDQLVGMGYDFNYIDGNEIFPGFANSFVTSTEQAETKKDLYTKFFHALNKGMYFMYLNPEAGADITMNIYPDIDVTWEGAVSCAMGRVDQAFDIGGKLIDYYVDEVGIGYMEADKWTSLMEKDVQAGVIKEVMDPEKCFTNDIIPGPLSAEDKAQVEADAAAYECTSELYKSAH